MYLDKAKHIYMFFLKKVLLHDKTFLCLVKDTHVDSNSLMYIYILKYQIIPEVLSCNYDMKDCSKIATYKYGNFNIMEGSIIQLSTRGTH